MFYLSPVDGGLGDSLSMVSEITFLSSRRANDDNTEIGPQLLMLSPYWSDTQQTSSTGNLEIGMVNFYLVTSPRMSAVKYQLRARSIHVHYSYHFEGVFRKLLTSCCNESGSEIGSGWSLSRLRCGRADDGQLLVATCDQFGQRLVWT